jgi:ElaA protein
MGQIQRWNWKSWDTLSRNELYALLQLRQAIFIVEQNCPYLDADGIDFSAAHLLGWDDKENLVGYSRVYLHENNPLEASIGRVIVHSTHRGSGLGYELMKKTEDFALRHWARKLTAFTLSAQSHLKFFYTKLGYEVCGPGYDEDGIPHLPMRKDL